MDAPPTDRKEDVHDAFRELRKARKARSRLVGIASKEKHARTEEDREIVEAASARSLESIVKGLAEVRLNFDHSVEALMDTLNREVATLRDTRRAIDVETRRTEALRNVKIAADALNLLKLQHEQAMEELEEAHRARREALDQEIAEERAAWEKEQAAFEQEVQQHEAKVREEREQAEETYQYEKERERRRERDAYEEKKRTTERRLHAQQEEKEADWTEREAALDARREQSERYESRLETFEQEKEEAAEAARREALASAREDVEAEAALVAGEVAAKRNSCQAKIALLEADVERQSEQIAELSNQLQSALRQTQQLSARAMRADANPSSTK